MDALKFFSCMHCTNRLATAIIFIFFSHYALSQVNVSAYGGFMNYDGDLQGKRFTTDQSHPAFGIGVGYTFMDRFSVSYNVVTGKVSASDAKSGSRGRIPRNLDFTSSITEVNLLFEANLFDISVHSITPYGFAGIAAFKFDPYTTGRDGEKVYLQPLNTEGQGLPEFPDRKPYKLTQFSIPFGAGIKFRITETFSISGEIGLRKTFTDYIDDVSSAHFVDTALLAAAYGPQSAAYSFRGDEIDPPTSLSSRRGNPDKKDTYYTCLFKLTYNFKKASIFKY